MCCFAGWPGPANAPSPALERAAGERLSENTPERLLRTDMTRWGDFMIEFVLREQGDAWSNRAAALTDTLAIVRGVYEVPARRPITVKLLGVWRPSPIASTVPLLYASLPAGAAEVVDFAGGPRSDIGGRSAAAIGIEALRERAGDNLCFVGLWLAAPVRSRCLVK